MRRVLWLAAFVPLAAVAACSESANGPIRISPLAGAPVGLHALAPSDSAREVVAPVALGDVDSARIVAVRFHLAEGALEIAIRDGSRAEAVTQRVSRLGENLVVLPVAANISSATLVLVQPAATGRLSAMVRAVDLVELSEAHAAAEAARLAHEFEAETGKLGNPEPPNLVPNSDFVEDDEVRGTPADWLAYVPTTVDPHEHELRASGIALAGRPVLATAPMRTIAGRRYRAACRIRVDRGSVALRAVDYDETLTLAASPPLEAGAVAELSLEFVGPDNPPAVRLQIAPATGDAVEIRISDIQLELLP